MQPVTKWGALLALVCVAAAPAMAETMYARFSAPVRSGRTLRATTIGTLKQGEAVEVAAREGRYFRVQYRGQSGYVYYNKLAEQKPEDVAALLGGAPGAGGIELAELEAGGALRGLSPMAQDYVEAADVPAWAVQAVESMQAVEVTLQQLEAFQRQGRLGEYGEGDGR